MLALHSLFYVLAFLTLLTSYAIHDYIKIRHGENTWAALFKGAATALCLAVFIYRVLPGNLENGFELHAIIFATAIALCVAADITLCFRFNAGVALFGLAHIFFIAALAFNEIDLLSFTISFLVALSSMGLLIAQWKLLKRENPVYFVYLLLLAVMIGLSVGRGGWLFLGALAFMTSDLILIYCRFVKEREWVNRANLGLYYTGIFLLALFY
ncbi:MAG: lysoplasmalogenase [Defluviitaleaceae bacterium]|nr:lysoplasmalogenase [Defluviitaleaceae bacterium]